MDVSKWKKVTFIGFQSPSWCLSFFSLRWSQCSPEKISHIKLPSSATRASPEREFTQSSPPIGREAASRWFTVFMLRWRPLYVTPGVLLWAAWCLQPSRDAKSVINIDEILQPGFYSVRMLPWILNLTFLWALRTSNFEFIFYFQLIWCTDTPRGMPFDFSFCKFILRFYFYATWAFVVNLQYSYRLSHKKVVFLLKKLKNVHCGCI